jgi:tetratricopeptide (TPR) repeat protein
VSPREQYMIRGQYYSFKNEREKAIGEFEALHQLYPDDEEVNDELINLYTRVGQAKAALPLMIHQADMRPLSATEQAYVAQQLLSIRGDMTGAKKYVRLADDLRKKGAPANGVWLDFFPAFEAWYGNDSTQALAEVNRIMSLPVAKSNERRGIYASFGAEFYLGLGRIHDAERVSQGAHQAGTPPSLDDVFVAFARNDTNAMRRSLKAIADGTKNQGYLPPIVTMLLMQAGSFGEASKGIAWGDSNHWSGGFQQTIEGQLAFYRGNIAEAVPLLDQGNQSLLDHGNGSSYAGFLGVETLARALESQGQITRAAAVLEEALQLKGGAVGGRTSTIFWLRDEYQLARMYRKLGRQQDAEKVEAGLRAELANADPDFPILVALNRIKSTSAALPPVALAH